MTLSKNFTIKEFTKSQAAERLGIDNTPSAEDFDRALFLFHKVVQPIRDHFNCPVIITSGYRSPELNKRIGGSATSQHMTGEAVDLEIPGVSNYDVAKWIEDNLEFDQLILEFYTPGVLDSGWVHVSYSKSKNRKEVLTASRENGRTVYKKGLIK